MSKRKVGVVTGTRAEYGLLYFLIKELHEDENIDLQLFVTGMHLSPEFGLTYKEIEKDFSITRKIEMLSKADTPSGICNSIGLASIGFGKAFEELKPDIVVVLGDRFEILAAAISAMINRIPIAHIHGGEATEGLIDEPIRHSITKMSHLHFVATEEYKNRVIQLGETPSRVFNFGGIGIDNINGLKLLNKDEFETEIGFKLDIKNILVTFHPVTLETNTSSKQFSELLKSIDKLEETNIIFTYANADTDGRIINRMIDEFVEQNKNKSVSFKSMGQLKYLSALQFVDVVVGNSSSGLAEVPSFKKATINIGDRQKGRVKAESVTDCLPIEQSIDSAFKTAFSEDFKKVLFNTVNPYGNGGVSQKIKSVLSEYDLNDDILKKKFYDLEIK
jgi:GDP/UDP-N,N'-diacetylbacillosamine 2-epimerase (hydrolysing)